MRERLGVEFRFKAYAEADAVAGPRRSRDRGLPRNEAIRFGGELATSSWSFCRANSNRPETFLSLTFCRAGSWYFEIARGRDIVRFQPDRERKSSGSEIAFPEDLLDPVQIEAGVIAMPTMFGPGARKRIVAAGLLR